MANVHFRKIGRVAISNAAEFTSTFYSFNVNYYSSSYHINITYEYL